MKKLQAYIDDNVMNQLKAFAEESGCSLSHAVNDIIVKHFSKKGENTEKSTNDSSRFSELLEQIFLCVYDEEKMANSRKNLLSFLRESNG